MLRAQVMAGTATPRSDLHRLVALVALAIWSRVAGAQAAHLAHAAWTESCDEKSDA